MKDLIKFISVVILGVVIVATSTHFAVVLSGTSLVLDSLGTNPSAPNSAYQSKFFSKQGSDGTIGFYRIYRGSVKRIDSVGSVNTRQDTLVIRFPVIERSNLSATDSLSNVFIPDSIKVDSIMSYQSGAASLTYLVYKDSAGTMVPLVSSAQSATSTWTTASGLQRNRLGGGNKLWTVVRSISGTATIFNIEIIFHRQ
jgi:hypothetical protein